MQQVLAIIRKLEVVIAGTFLVLMVVLIFGGGVARMLGTPLNWTTDFATCLFAWACFLCADIAWRNNSLMSVDMLTDRCRRACADRLPHAQLHADRRPSSVSDRDGNLSLLDQPRALLPGHSGDQLFLGDDEFAGRRDPAADHDLAEGQLANCAASTKKATPSMCSSVQSC